VNARSNSTLEFSKQGEHVNLRWLVLRDAGTNDIYALGWQAP
jgi:hypothetical protein